MLQINAALIYGLMITSCMMIEQIEPVIARVL